MILRPLNDNVIIEQDPDMEAVDNDVRTVNALKSKLIVLPEKNSVMKSSNTGTIMSWGSRCHYKWKTGQRIMFARFGGAKFNHEGKEYRMLKEWELLAIFE